MKRQFDPTARIEVMHRLDHIAHDHSYAWGARSGKQAMRFLTLGLCGEAGELANLVKKDWRGDKGDRRKPIRKELCDVFAYALMISKRLGFDLYEATLAKLEEVERRPEYQRAIRKANKARKRTAK